ncbi:hypothetical protein V6N13_020428 [Hibiscus sabdariffa]|uniref:Uncharacterized protein n=1 Tax=Hibiscus sabdariffa TaxID=183260 RepID=A0ABR2EV98_9ROSI
MRKWLEKYEGFKLKVGVTFSWSCNSFLITLHKKSKMELGFNLDIISLVGYATPLVSEKLAERCSAFGMTVVMQYSEWRTPLNQCSE